MCGGAAAPERTLVGSFGGTASLNISFVTGEILERLDCLPGELQGYGWRPFVVPGDLGVTQLMAAQLHAGQPGIYDLRAQPRRGAHVLHLRIRTFIVKSPIDRSIVRGVLDLRHCESRRRIVT